MGHQQTMAMLNNQRITIPFLGVSVRYTTHHLAITWASDQQLSGAESEIRHGGRSGKIHQGVTRFFLLGWSCFPFFIHPFFMGKPWENHGKMVVYMERSTHFEKNTYW